MIQKIFGSRVFCRICIVLILTNLSGCYSNFPVEMGKVHSSVEVSKIKLKDKTEVRFNTGENQLLTITDDHLIYLDSEGITRKVFLSDVDTFYTYKIDSGKVIFGSIWISLAAFFLHWLTSHAFGPVGG